MLLKYYETCCSQYHAGHHLPTVQAMVDGNTTYLDVQEALKDNFAYAHLEDQVFKAESHYDAYNKAVDVWFEKMSMPQDMPWDPSLGVPDDEDDEWDCYAYFIIEGVNEHLVEILRSRPNNCPYCNSPNITSAILDNCADLATSCHDCSEKWVEHYTLDEVTFDAALDT